EWFKRGEALQAKKAEALKSTRAESSNANRSMTHTKRVFNTSRQQTKETYHITSDESPKAIKFLKLLIDNINIAKSERYPPDEYLHPYEPSQSLPLPVPSMVTSAPQDRWSQDKHIELVNIIGFDIKGYSNSDYAGCNMDRKSTSAEAEYVAAAGCCANILWMKSQLTNYDIIYEKIDDDKDYNNHFSMTQHQI
nr:hypothetical protein [Tanacetum cinerariifolium]